MKVFLPALALIMLLSCSNEPDTVAEPVEEVIEKPSFFPVTSYIRGQLYEIKEKGINPLKYTTIDDKTDSVWLKLEDFEEAIKEFLQPEIDSVNLVSLFTEKKFRDQTLDAITLTYEPVGKLPDSMLLNKWDVYIDPPTGEVRRIYMVKSPGNTKMLQLTWQSNKWCKIISIVTDAKGISKVEKEEKITWDF
jgi:hypothetical protein